MPEEVVEDVELFATSSADKYEEYERKIEEYKDDSILKNIMGTKLNKTINQINFFENPANS